MPDHELGMKMMRDAASRLWFEMALDEVADENIASAMQSKAEELVRSRCGMRAAHIWVPADPELKRRAVAEIRAELNGRSQ